VIPGIGFETIEFGISVVVVSATVAGTVGVDAVVGVVSGAGGTDVMTGVVVEMVSTGSVVAAPIGLLVFFKITLALPIIVATRSLHARHGRGRSDEALLDRRRPSRDPLYPPLPARLGNAVVLTSV
jgi:hypothetical protein